MLTSEFLAHVQRLMNRALSEAYRDEHSTVLNLAREKGVAANAIRADPRSGATVRERTLLSAGKRAIAESIEAVSQVYGTYPLEVLAELRGQMTKQFDVQCDQDALQLAHAYGYAAWCASQMKNVAALLKMYLEIELSPIEMRAKLAVVAHGTLPSQFPGRRERDVFVSHASEDKTTVAVPLMKALELRGLKVWLDKFEIAIGSRIYDAIDSGLRESRFGVIILSPAFFSKRWPRRELAALAALEDAEGGDRILPVWHDVDGEDFARYSALLASVRAADTKQGIDHVADEIVEAVKRDRAPAPDP